VPVAAYEAMLAAGRRFPTFVLPLPRAPTPGAPAPADADAQAYEMFVLQWSAHAAPAVPTHESATSPFPLAPPPGAPNPAAASVLFAPLAAYKLQQDFAAPQLVLAFHTELARTHGVVLLRGELTPTGSAAADGAARYWLSQADAQLLALGLQKFYLWQGDGADARQRLLEAFHERPADFNWEELLHHAKPTI
jgi:ATP synthase F1 complex assembly factor 1